MTTPAGVIRDLGARHTLIVQIDEDVPGEVAESYSRAFRDVFADLPSSRRPRILVIAGAARLAAVRVAPRSLPGRKRLPRWAR